MQIFTLYFELEKQNLYKYFQKVYKIKIGKDRSIKNYFSFIICYFFDFILLVNFQENLIKIYLFHLRSVKF